MRIALAFLFAMAMSVVAATPPITSSPWTTNYGNGGSNTMFQMIWSSTASGHPMDVAMTPMGGLAIRMTNGTGSNSVLGQVVQPIGSTDGGGGGPFVRTYTCNSTNELLATDSHIFRFIGTVAEGGVPAGGLTWITISGPAWALVSTTTDPGTHGMVAYCSISEYGKIRLAGSVPAYFNVFTNRIKVLGQLVGNVAASTNGTNLALVLIK